MTCWWRSRIPSAPCTNDIMIGLCPIWFHLVWPFSVFLIEYVSSWDIVTFKMCPIGYDLVSLYWLLTQLSFREVVLNQLMGQKQYPGELNLFNAWLKPLSKESTKNHLTTRVNPHALIEIDSWLERFLCRGYLSNFNCVPKPSFGTLRHWKSTLCDP